MGAAAMESVCSIVGQHCCGETAKISRRSLQNRTASDHHPQDLRRGFFTLRPDYPERIAASYRGRSDCKKRFARS
jgi:hypothetical protein